jgi:hypothetical protein
LPPETTHFGHISKEIGSLFEMLSIMAVAEQMLPTYEGGLNAGDTKNVKDVTSLLELAQMVCSKLSSSSVRTDTSNAMLEIAAALNLTTAVDVAGSPELSSCSIAMRIVSEEICSEVFIVIHG